MDRARYPTFAPTAQRGRGSSTQATPNAQRVLGQSRCERATTWLSSAGGARTTRERRAGCPQRPSALSRQSSPPRLTRRISSASIRLVETVLPAAAHSENQLSERPP